jgi:hypothetical protein
MANRLINIPGVGQVAFPDTMSEMEITAAAKKLHDEANAPEPQGLLGGAWEAAKKGGAAALEAIGRPAELVSGTVAGALAPERDLTRGVRAFFEPLVGGTQDESFSKVLQEQTPEFAKAHPWLTGGAGLAADIVTDPLNLLGGAGFVRKGLLKGAKAAGLSEGTAKAALGLPIGEAFQSSVVPKIAQTMRTAAEATPLRKLMSDVDLQKVIVDGTLTGKDVKWVAGQRKQAIQAVAEAKLGKITADFNLTQADRELLGLARGDRAAAARVAADPRLQQAQQAFTDFFDELRTGDIAKGVLQERQSLDVADDLRKALLGLTSAQDWTALRTALKTTATGEVDPAAIARLPENLRTIAQGLVESPAVRRGETIFKDLGTLKPHLKNGKVVDITVSTRQPQYFPQFRNMPETVQGVAFAAAPSGTLKAAEQKVRSLKEAVAAGMSTDIGEMAARRAADSARARSQTELIQQYAKAVSDTPFAGARQLKDTTLENLSEPLQQLYKGKYVPEAIANELERVTVRLRDPQYADTLLNRGLRVWKTWATAMNLPGHQLVNFSGNAGNMYAVANMPIDDVFKYYMQAGNTLNRARRGGQLSKDWETFLKEAQDIGVVGPSAGPATEFRPRGPMTKAAEAVSGQRYNPLNPEAPYYQAARDLNQKYVEDPARLATYVWARQQGKSAEEAALLVKQALFDYNDLNDFEKQYLRNVIPFYTWTRKNVPAQLATLLQRPVKLANQKRLIETFDQIASAGDAEPLDKSKLPDYMQGPEFFRVPGVTTSEKEPVMAASRLPVFDLNMLTADPKQLAEKAGFMLSPAIRIPLEQLLGRRLGSGTPIESTRLVEPNALQKLTGLGIVQTPQGPKTTSEARYWADQLPLPLGAVARTTAAGMDEKADVNPFTEFLMRSFGTTPTPVTAEMLRRAELAQRKATLAARRSRALDED